MTFEVVPAIDVAAGRLVTASSSKVTAIASFEGDPRVAARTFVDRGAPRLHLVDVDLARTGQAPHLALVGEIAALGVPVQASGGVTTAAQVSRLLDAGAERVVLGSAALLTREETERMISRYGERIVVGLEADGATIRPRGRDLELPLWDTLVWLGRLDVRRFLLTEVGRVGALGGPDLDGVWALATRTGRPVLAAGGVRDLDDLRALAALGDPVEGAVVGRALYEGLDLRAALDAVAGPGG